MHRPVAASLGLVCALAAGSARAAPSAAPAPASAPPASASGVAVFALIVGSNSGGPGQAALRYAEDDARRVAATLVELGGTPAGAVDLVVHPTPAILRERLAQLADKVAAARAAGQQTRVVFYYSGHARSTAIDLGADEFALGDLRQRLFGIPSTLTVVVLDACQSGAFSRIKGAQPAADFSFNSRQHLDATGVAVLASSSGSELSQESEQLRSSYFTHHLLIGLRGAGDADRDGQVSIDEAYRYAYHQTLLATAETAVGGQHVSLEVDLKGHGDVALTFPRAATAAIELPAGLEGQALVEDRRSRTVVAETYKARGAPIRIAVAPGDYRVLVRHAGVLARCEVQATIGAATFALERCPTEPIVVAAAKGAGLAEHRMWFELRLTAGGERADGFTRTLGAFGFDRTDNTIAGFTLGAMRQLDPRLSIGGFAAFAGSPRWQLSTERQPLRFSWNTAEIGALVRAHQPLADHGFASRFAGYAQLGGGLGLAGTELVDQDDRRTSQRFYGWAVTAGAGLHVDCNRGFGFSLGYQFDYAPVIENLTGDTHASGGHRLTTGLSYAY
jgi:hypothetical protein